MKKTIPVSVGNIIIGGGNPIVVQSMTNTDTADITATASQILELAEAGSEIVRITVDCPESARAVPEIIKKVRQTSSVPIVGDFHFNGHILLEKYPKTAEMLDKYRINPGNVGKGEKKDEQFERILSVAKKYNKPIRIGVNGGSLDSLLLQQKMDNAKGTQKSSGEIFEEAIIESVLSSAKYAVHFGIPKNKILLSAKVSSPDSLLRIYRILLQKTNFPLHLGLTEAGAGIAGVVATTAALSPLLQEKIGDTIRVSITPNSGESRTKEVYVAKEILQAVGARQFFPRIISCPGCGRTTGNDFQAFTEEITKKIEEKMPTWKQKNSSLSSLKIAVMGCIVNGPGEASHADIGIFFPGKGEGKKATIFVQGEKKYNFSGENIVDFFLEVLEKEFVKKGR